MNTTDVVLNSLVELVKLKLNQELVGIYLYGSLVHGDFDEKLSDVDLLVVTKCSVDELNHDELTKMHERFNNLFPEWSERIDLAYVSHESLESFKSKDYEALTIHGTQKLAKTSSKPHWLIDWYKVLNQSQVLFGPEPSAVLPDITKEEFRSTIREYILGWPDETKPKTDPADLAYVVLAICRSMYAYTTFENVSKRKGAEWAQNEFPQFTELIKEALTLSRMPKINVEQELIDPHEVLRFVEHVCSKVR